MENVTSLSDVKNFFQFFFLKNNNKTNKQEQNISLNPKKNLLDTPWKGRPSKTETKNLIFHNLN